jgi:hypothetical protein
MTSPTGKERPGVSKDEVAGASRDAPSDLTPADPPRRDRDADQQGGWKIRLAMTVFAFALAFTEMVTISNTPIAVVTAVLTAIPAIIYALRWLAK